MIELRPYQSGAISAIYQYFEANAGNPLIVLPTASGKSVVLASFTARAIADWPDTRILIVTHVKELIAQNYAEMIRLWPDAPAGIYSAGLNKRDLHAQILFAGIQSIHKRAYDIQRCDLALIDECHLCPRTSDTMYRRFLGDLTTINPHLKVIGFTAT
ncbi:MAG: DEAD/DEAH box helicase family protein, partial [Defluviicoccus sp.]